ncbi:MAG TPA: MazG nucleotide pyrophosphohydrolase domain-containing protein [Candidatus Bathyarchaeia archaeon]|nr:MazG nucleotide pyrophosphohydrolase domain-containing protein [Candidatus Bathyarchaeia archaeon]
MTDLIEICREIDDLIQQLGGYWSKEWLIHPVIEELGEFSKELQIYGGLHPNKTTSIEKLTEEYGDLVFAVLALGRGLKIDIESAIKNTLRKYSARDKN